MCGILGVIGGKVTSQEIWSTACLVQAHRGPDGFGEWFGTVGEWQVSLAHQRLSILDLSQSGAQPMIHPVTKSILVFNGEIYNFIELKAELMAVGISFDGHCDTEILLRGLEYWGIEATLPRLNGMWAFAWVDQRNRRVHLSRDRTGEKPLYLARRGQRILFASELKTLLTLLDDPQHLNPSVIAEFLALGLLDVNTQTMFDGIEQVASGCLQSFALEPSGIDSRQEKYWECPVKMQHVVHFPNFIENLREEFFRSVRYRLRSDVPVGILLSGGLDSSAIAGAAKAIGAVNLHLLSAVSDDVRFDESPFIDAVSRHLDWPVIKVRLPEKPEELFNYLDRATWFMDAPVCSLSNVAHYLLMKSAKEQGITVILSGQGADELLCGYRKYLGFYIQSLLRNRQYLKSAKVVGQFLFNETIINQFNWGEAKRYLPAFAQTKRDSISGPAIINLSQIKVGLGLGASLNERQLLDVTSLSVPTLNHGEDRMSMSWSREIRLPFLDPQLIELLISAPTEYKLYNGWTKYSLRRAMEPFLPPDVIWRKDKQGFVNPQSEWLKNNLREQILNEYFHEDANIFKLGFIDRHGLLNLYQQYVKQQPKQGTIFFREIFHPLALEVWLRQYRSFIVGLA